MGRPSKYLVGTDRDKAARKEKAVEKKVKKPAAPPSDPQIKEQAKIVAGIEEKELSKEQIAKLINDFSKKDPYNFKGLDSRFRYRLLNRSSDKLDRQTMRGWVIVTGPEAEKIADINKIHTRQGQIIVGDGVLAKIPMEVYVAYMAKLRDLNKRVIGQSTATLRRDMGSKYSRNVEESLKTQDRGQREETVL